MSTFPGGTTHGEPLVAVGRPIPGRFSIAAIAPGCSHGPTAACARAGCGAGASNEIAALRAAPNESDLIVCARQNERKITQHDGANERDDQERDETQLDRVERDEDRSDSPVQNDEANRQTDGHRIVFANAFDAGIERIEARYAADCG